MYFDVVFINDYSDYTVPYSLGLVALSTYLNKRGFRACVMNMSDFKKNKDIDVHFFGIGGWSCTFWKVVKIAHKLKRQFPQIPIIAGGGHLSSCPADFHKHAELFDYWVIGEGERAIVGILENKYKKNEQIQVPINEHDLVSPQIEYLGTPEGFHVSITSRGCSHNCTFCSIPRVSNSGPKNLSSKELLQNIHRLVEKGVSTIYFGDSNIMNNRKWAEEFCLSACKADFRFSWSANCCMDGINEETVVLLHKAGCVSLRTGVETGAPDILNAMRKQARLNNIQSAVALCKKIGIKVHAYFLYGMLGETRQSMRQTRDFYNILKPDTFYLTLYRPYPGTVMYAEATSKGYLNEHDWSIGKYAELEHTGHLSKPEVLKEKELLWGQLLRQKKKRYLKQTIVFNGNRRPREFVFLKKIKKVLLILKGIMPKVIAGKLSLILNRMISKAVLQECLDNSTFLEDKLKQTIEMSKKEKQ